MPNRPSKKWWDQKYSEIKEKEPSYTDEQIRGTVGQIFKDLSPSEREKAMSHGSSLKTALDMFASDPSLKPPKRWWTKKTKEIADDNPSYDSETVDATVGKIWSDLSDSEKSKIRQREGKTYGPAKESSLRRAIVAAGAPVLKKIELVIGEDLDPDMAYFETIHENDQELVDHLKHRLEQFEDGEFNLLEIYGEAEIEESGRTETIRSLGWGDVESDNWEYAKEIINDQFKELRGELEERGVDLTNFDQMCAEALEEAKQNQYFADTSSGVIESKESHLLSAIRAITAGERILSYEDALKEAKRVGAGKAEGLPLLAQTIWALSRFHAINPKLVYEGAIKQGLSAKEVRKLGPVDLGDLMFVAQAAHKAAAEDEDDNLIFGVDEKNNIVYYKEFPAGSKFPDNVVQYIYKLAVGQGKGDSLGDMTFGMHYKITFDPPLRVAEDEENIWQEPAAILSESNDGHVGCAFYASEEDAERAWEELERTYEKYLSQQGIGD